MPSPLKCPSVAANTATATATATDTAQDQVPLKPADSSKGETGAQGSTTNEPAAAASGSLHTTCSAATVADGSRPTENEELGEPALDAVVSLADVLLPFSAALANATNSSSSARSAVANAHTMLARS